MTLSLYTDTPRFCADLMEVVHLFYPEAKITLTDEATADLAHRFSESERQWTTAFSYMGQGETRTRPAEGGTEIEKKRALKRMIKQTLYDLLKAVTGIRPPWGSLTGVRPTRLFYEQLEKGKSSGEAQTYLETVFDVTHEKTALLSDIVQTQQQLQAPKETEADVYIGIPFCASLCAYCSFASGEIGDGRLVAPYLDALEYDMKQTAKLMKDAGLTLRALYVGGGTPSALGEDDFKRLLASIRNHFENPAEITVEAGRPDTLTRAKLAALYDAQIGRVSINPQTMNDKTLKAIGRNHTSGDVYRAYQMAREAGLRHINMDIIAGLPQETVADFENTLAGVSALAPEALTVHTLALKRASRMRLLETPLPDAEATSQMVRLAGQAAKDMGLVPYYLYRQKYMAGNQENVGYAGQGRACLYNIDMMEEACHILGIGAGAISKRLFRGESRIGRAPNVSDVQSYIARAEEMVRRKQMLWNHE